MEGFAGGGGPGARPRKIFKMKSPITHFKHSFEKSLGFKLFSKTLVFIISTYTNVFLSTSKYKMFLAI